MGRKPDPNAATRHPWYRTWQYHKVHHRCPWATFWDFVAWAEDRDYDPKRGDRVVLRADRRYGFYPRVVKAGEPDNIPSAKQKADSAATKALKDVWQTMMNRCYRGADPYYKVVGGAGVRVVEEWHDFVAFQAWAMSVGYKIGDTLFRKQFEFDYGPENCIFAYTILTGRSSDG